MEHQKEERVLAVANAYSQKFYFNPKFENLPTAVKKEIKILCVEFVEEIGGVLELSFRESDDSLQLVTYRAEDDFVFDEIGAELRIKEYQREKEELFRQLELYFQGTLVE